MEKHFSNAFNLNDDKYIKKTKKRLLFIDSRDCLEDVHNPFNFTIKLDKTIGIDQYRNIEKIELKNYGIPKMSNKEHYVILDIPDFFDYLDSSDNASHRSSCILYYNDTSQSTGNVKQSYENHEFDFEPRLSALNNLKFKITKHGGNEISSSDFLGITFSDLYTTFLFEISYLP